MEHSCSLPQTHKPKAANSHPHLVRDSARRPYERTDARKDSGREALCYQPLAELLSGCNAARALWMSIGSVLLSFPFPFHHPGSTGFPTLLKGKKAAAYRILARSPPPASASSWSSRLGMTPGCTGYPRVASCTVCCGSLCKADREAGDECVCRGEQDPGA